MKNKKILHNMKLNFMIVVLIKMMICLEQIMKDKEQKMNLKNLHKMQMN